MPRLEDMLPPGEMVRWKSPKPAWWEFSGATLAVTEAHVVWVGDGDARVALREIDAIDAEEGGVTLNLHINGETRRVEEFGGNVAEAARATGRPARVWRECRSPGAVKAQRWQSNIGTVAAVIAAGGIMGLLFLVFGGGSFKGFGGVVLAGAGALGAQPLAGIAQRTLPHLLAGHRLSGDERRDFIGWITDLRWHGVKPDGPDDGRMPRSRLGEWAMRKAYGEIPDIGERDPEILVRGEFPPTAEAD